MNEHLAVQPEAVTRGWRPKFGVLLLILAVVSPLLAPLILAADLPMATRRAMAGLLLFGVPMALMLVVVAMIGRPAYVFITSRTLGHGAFTEEVGVTRYRIGLAMVMIAALVSWIEPLVSPHVPVMQARRVLIGAIADGMVLIGLFVLGGVFWDKVRALFVHDSRVVVDRSLSSAGAAQEPVQVGWRFYLGAALFLCALLAWLLVPLATSAGWSTSKIATLSGILFISNKIALLAAIAIMGKPGFNHLKRLLFGFFRKFGPSQQVGRTRYHVGLIVLMVPVLLTWIAPYAPAILGNEGIYASLENRALELLLLVGLFLLGGEFWDKVSALFKHRAKVEFGPAR